MRRKLVVVSLLFAVVLVFLSPLASSLPDGLRRVAEDHGFADRISSPAPAPLPGYSVPGIRQASVSTIIAGLAGTLVDFGLAVLSGKLLMARRQDNSDASTVGRDDR